MRYFLTLGGKQRMVELFRQGVLTLSADRM